MSYTSLLEADPYTTFPSKGYTSENQVSRLISRGLFFTKNFEPNEASRFFNFV